MSFKDILVHLDHSPSCNERVAAALKLARLHEAHLTAVYVKTKPVIPGYIEAQLSEDILKAQDEAFEASAQEVIDGFEKAASAEGIRFETRKVNGDLTDQLILHSRYADVVVLGQRDSSYEGGPGASELPDQVLLRSGRPVIVIPHSGKFATMGERITVAWDGSRLATRALNDSMPLLTRAKQVNVLAVNPQKGTGLSKHGALPGADIALHLARHDVKAEADHITSGELDPGDALLSYVSDNAMDMIVMGGYGHRRWRELVLGGVTRHILKHMTVPVFMTH